MSIFSHKNKNSPSKLPVEVDALPNTYLSENSIGIKKLELSDEDKERLFSQINAVKPQIIDGLKNAAIANLYMVKFPEGLPKVLTQLKQGGCMSFIHDKGRIVGTASLVQASAGSIAVLNVFTVMSVVTGQYFLANINSQLSAINNKLDMIQASLDNDKKALLKSVEERIWDIIDGNRGPDEIKDLDKDADHLMKYYISELDTAYEQYKKKKDDSFNRVLSMCVLLNQSMIALVQCRIIEALCGQRDLNIVRNETEDIINRCYDKTNAICSEMKGGLESKRIQNKKVKGHLQALSDFGIESRMEERILLQKKVSQAIDVAGANEIVIDSNHDLYLPVRT